MKTIKTLLLAITLSFSISLSAQIKVIENNSTEIGKVTAGGKKFDWITVNNGNYSVFYRDEQYQQIDDYKHFSFSGEETFNYLYDLLKKQCKAPKKTELTIEVGDANITITSYKHYISLSILAEGQPNGFFRITSRQLDKLFGKKKTKKKKN